MTENKKIRNATITKAKGITFKSKLEKCFYETLLQQGFEPKYEFKTFVLFNGFTPITPFYDKETDSQKEKREALEGEKKSSRQLVLKSAKVIPFRYTPDFFFKYKDYNVYIEAKGIENSVYYIKKKLFRKVLDDEYINTGVKSLFFEVYTKKQLLQAINIIKEYGESTENNKGINS